MAWTTITTDPSIFPIATDLTSLAPMPSTYTGFITDLSSTNIQPASLSPMFNPWTINNLGKGGGGGSTRPSSGFLYPRGN